VPVSFFQTVSEKLCLLDLSSNQLTMIPFVISKLKSLVTLKLKENGLKSLVDLCLVNLTKSGSRSKIDETCLPMRLLEYWDTMQTCSCGKLCLWSSHVRGLIKTNPSRVTQTFITDGNLLGSEAFLRCETLFCSKKCIELYKNQPLNFR